MTDHAMKEHLVKIVKSRAIAAIMVHVTHNLVSADAPLDGKEKIAIPSVNLEISDSIAYKNVIVISTIRSHAMPSMDIAFVKAHGQVSVKINHLNVNRNSI